MVELVFVVVYMIRAVSQENGTVCVKFVLINSNCSLFVMTNNNYVPPHANIVT